MRRKPHPQHAAIAKQLGTTPAMLKALLSVKAGRSSMNRGRFLVDKGFVTTEPPFSCGWRMTDAGNDLLARARALGF